jgi:hypothetical protein
MKKNLDFYCFVLVVDAVDDPVQTIKSAGVD